MNQRPPMPPKNELFYVGETRRIRKARIAADQARQKSEVVAMENGNTVREQEILANIRNKTLAVAGMVARTAEVTVVAHLHHDRREVQKCLEATTSISMFYSIMIDCLSSAIGDFPEADRTAILELLLDGTNDYYNKAKKEYDSFPCRHSAKERSAMDNAE